MSESHLAVVLVRVCLIVTAGAVAWDLIVLVGLVIDAVRRRRGRRPIRVGVDYGAGEGTWFERTPGAEPYRSCDERRPLARGDPAAAAQRVAGAVAVRLGVVSGVALIPAAAQAFSARLHDLPISQTRMACLTIRQGTLRWMAADPRRGCPTVEDLKADHDLDTWFYARDPWGSAYTVHCNYVEITCASPGPDRRRDTEADIVVPGGEADGTVSR